MPTSHINHIDNYTLELLLVIVDSVAIKCFKSKIWKYSGTVKVPLQIFRTLFVFLVLVGMFNMLVAEVCFLTKQNKIFFESV